MSWKLSNFASSTLSQSLALGATTAYIDADEVDLLPVLAPGDSAKLVIFNNTYREIVNITAWTTDGVLTITRGQEGTAARDWEAGTKVVHTPTAELLQNILSATASNIFTGTTTNVGNLYTVNVGAGNTLPAFTDGELATFTINATNSGAVTLRFTDGTTTTATKDVTHMDSQALASGDFLTSWTVQVRYSSSADDWQLLTAASNQVHITQLNDNELPAVNRHRNGRFDFWNNGTSFATPASGSETADGWKVHYDGSIGTFSIARQAFTPGQTDVPGDPRYFLRWDHSSAGSGSTYRKLQVPIPNVAWKEGARVTRRIYLKADASRTVNARVYQTFGTGGSPSAQVLASNTNLSVTTSWQAFDISIDLPSIAGKTLGSNLDDTLDFELWLPVNVTMTIDIAVDDIRPGAYQGLQSFSYPVPWWMGGTGGSYDSVTDFATTNSLYTSTSWATANPDLVAIEALAGTSGLLAKTAANTWALRNLAVGTGLSVSNPAGVAGDPTVSLGTALANYVADPLSVAELASVTGNFGTAAFVNTGTSGATVPLLNGANTFSAAQIVSLTVAGTVLTLSSSDAGATAGPNLLLDRASASPAASDIISEIIVRGRDSGAGSDDYFTLRTTIVDPTAASEDGRVSLLTPVAGTLTEHLRLEGGGIQAPQGSASVPAYGFLGVTNTGMYTTAGELAFTNSGTVRYYSNTSRLHSTLTIWGPDGSATLPTFSWHQDTDNGDYRIGADNIGRSIGGTLRMDWNTTRLLFASGYDAVLNSATGPSSVDSMGFRGAPLGNSRAAANSAYTFVLADAGCTIYHDEVTARTYTIPANASVAFPIGTVIIIDNTGNSGAAGTITLSITTDTLRRGDGVSGTGSRTIAANQVAAIRKTKSTEWVITGIFS